jgi:Kef-type K+ transport system membrane component KefB
MELLEIIRSHALALPNLSKFAIGIALIVGIPPLCRRIRLPGVVGLLFVGVLLGPHGLNFFGEKRPIADFLSGLGKLLLMFFAGLEIDVKLFMETRGRSLGFGLLTCAIPQILGTAVALAAGYGTNAAIVIGSFLGSHTLLAFPILQKLGAVRLQSITVTIGATIVATIVSLVVFAICVPIHQSGFSPLGLALQLIEIAGFLPLILIGLGRLGSYGIRRTKSDEEAQFVLVLTIIALAAVLAQVINLPGIVGAFLAGIAINEGIAEQPSKEKLEFFGNSFFIPIFFIVTGFLIDPPVFISSIVDNFYLVAGVVLALVAGKWIAGEAAGAAFGYSRATRLTIWSLTLPQVAATLAAALVAYDTVNASGQRLIDGRMLNVVLVLLLVTSILGPILTERSTPRMLEDEVPAAAPKPLVAKS